jgi:(1->4)-alpha-D-glucan 1-alpha-D-glucosylmutase
MLMQQTLVGAHPLGAERAHAYLTKAMREAKRRTSWLDPDRAFEDAAHAGLDRALQDPEHMGEIEALAALLLAPGRSNSLSQKLLALTMPGVPDLYQGSELWSLDLVDPDNRRAVDYDLRRRLLARVPGAPTAADAAQWAASLHDPTDPGVAKLAVVHHALAVRHRHRGCFIGRGATYVPVEAGGPAADHVLAFERGAEVVTVVARHTRRLEREGGWRGTELRLPAGAWRDVLTQSAHTGAVDVERVLAHLPVALLVRA